MSRKIVFVGGIHGVGKTKFCRRISQYLNIDHVIASELVVDNKEPSIIKQKQVHDVEKNQDILLQSLRKYKTHHETILLDGHFCLLDTENNIEKIPLSTFERISPIAAMVLTASTNLVQERIEVRDNVPYEKELVADFQLQEIEHAIKISETLKIPLLIINSATDFYDAVGFINKWTVE